MAVSYVSTSERVMVTYLCEFFDTLNFRFRLIEGIENFHCVGGNLLSATSHSMKSLETGYRRSQALVDYSLLLSGFQVFVEFIQFEVY